MIAGGESGPARRPPRVEWLRGLRDHCLATGVAFTFKGWGGRVQGAQGRVLDGREWDDRPPLVAQDEGGATAGSVAVARQGTLWDAT